MKTKDKHDKQKKQTVLTSMTSKVSKLLKEAFTEKQRQIIMYIRFSMKCSIHCIVMTEEMLLLSKLNSRLFRQNDYNKDI